MDGSVDGDIEPIFEIYRSAKFGLTVLETGFTTRLSGPCWAVGDIDGDPPQVGEWFKESDVVLQAYTTNYQLLVKCLDRIRELRRTPTVSELVFRTLAREQREGAYIDQATRIIERGTGLFLRLCQWPHTIGVERTEVGYFDLVDQSRRIWFDFGYDPADFKDLYHRLAWELSVIELDRKPTYKSEQSKPVEVSDSQCPPSAIGLASCWCDKPRKLGGPTVDQAKFVGLLIDNAGSMSHADLSVSGRFDWEDSRKGATNMSKRINQKLAEHGELWSIIPEDNSRCLIVLNSESETRS